MLNALMQALSEERDIESIAAGIRAGMKEQLVSGMSGSARQVMMAALHKQLERPVLVVTHNMFSAQKVAEDLQECLSSDEVLLYPANELVAAEAAISSPEVNAQRIEVLTRSAQGFRGIVVTPYAGLRRFLPAREVMAQATVSLTIGDVLPLEKFLDQMVSLGYERTERVETKGEMSVRGGIVDIYPLTSPFPYRIEWFDDEVDSIRSFDPHDQRSMEKLKQLTITPSQDLIADKTRFGQAAEAASSRLEDQLSKMADRQVKDKLEQEIGYEIERLRGSVYFKEMYKYVSVLYPEQHTLYDYMPEDTLLIMDEPARVMETAKQLDRDEMEWSTHLLQNGKTLPSLQLGLNADDTLAKRPFQTVFMALFLRQVPHTQPQNIVNVMCRTMQNFHGQMNVLKAEMERWKKTGANVIMLANGDERADRIRRVLQDYQIPEPTILKGNLQSGFELPSVHLVVITEGEMFSQKQRKARRTEQSAKMDNAERIRSYTELKVGDYVVHQNHGIGKYIGIGTLEINGIHKDYLHILYAGGDKLSVPVDQLHLIQRYVSSEEKEPKVYKLGGTEWTKVKNKVRSSVKDIADDLIKLYAARQASSGYAFEKDTPEQREFEEMFPYDETRDQLRTIEEIKKDMEMPRPMDRLLCGDVGYGKTEVAVRAAFKAAIEGKQVAILVPTTILAQQHYETFRERFAEYPFNIQVMSRFRSRKEQNETIKGLKTGVVDIVIGTHRLLSQDVVFKDLGMLIVDEEQRFGVTHKEKLKRLKMNVDVLTLTATPIPRTLHMSMLGVRDLSVIETPPENRFPVQTYVLEYSDALVREAIERELARNGQVYFLFNRVQGIHQMADHIKMLVPEARVTVSHGQMSEQELEKTILDFLDGEYDVLVSTSIIETGVDIPNVNTLIVHDADKMGLSQLYQLRGRVGRSNRIAYAYFTYQRDKVLNEVAEKRLQAIKEFTELGSGFKIAMRDLSIRGAGNLLGAEQHGFIASVGFDLYSQMLGDEINKRKAELDGIAIEEQQELSTLIDLNIDAYLPPNYIYDSIQKIEIYKKVAGLASLDEVEELRDELIDRFGEPPLAVLQLLAVARLKLYAKQYGLESIVQRGDAVTLKVHPSAEPWLDRKKLAAIATSIDRRIAVDRNTHGIVKVNARGMDAMQLLMKLEQFMQEAKDAIKSKGELQNVAK
ncbi:transcription-repair coupling factor [Paenibacillus apiarius]|uniref:Transcription-repair-coupling factor n=1 Tax=Paenibacillus apiarius TaxID=46240 RepID=A0ABT4E334_9BACL|nr:transcription-repair coupling factor [Paenibacillus apiarius]MCY9517294.1 transcription-repair coupling factor [Paenibacillus apiarius]MCY9522646.1 transcription-repair coupling factor [Paenibacillus apiarius]MCY9555505.1 transcription-repair coupling factor [Paenibacillus apiarius]MCY9561373.1 transcription-repair coupling factor [Paenibacillus apiarius]MCY9684994.1 transcription-repair coupling factor [Paenibacillus apiarius]